MKAYFFKPNLYYNSRLLRVIFGVYIALGYALLSFAGVGDLSWKCGMGHGNQWAQDNSPWSDMTQAQDNEKIKCQFEFCEDTWCSTAIKEFFQSIDKLTCSDAQEPPRRTLSAVEKGAIDVYCNLILKKLKAKVNGEIINLGYILDSLQAGFKDHNVIVLTLDKKVMYLYQGLSDNFIQSCMKQPIIEILKLLYVRGGGHQEAASSSDRDLHNKLLKTLSNQLSYGRIITAHHIACAAYIKVYKKNKHVKSTNDIEEYCVSNLCDIEVFMVIFSDILCFISQDILQMSEKKREELTACLCNLGGEKVLEYLKVKYKIEEANLVCSFQSFYYICVNLKDFTSQKTIKTLESFGDVQEQVKEIETENNHNKNKDYGVFQIRNLNLSNEMSKRNLDDDYELLTIIKTEQNEIFIVFGIISVLEVIEHRTLPIHSSINYIPILKARYFNYISDAIKTRKSTRTKDSNNDQAYAGISSKKLPSMSRTPEKNESQITLARFIGSWVLLYSHFSYYRDNL